MASKRSRRRTAPTKPKALAGGGDLRALERRVRRLEATLAAERARHARQLENVRRNANRRLAAMMQEIATLRHHEARADALARMLTARDQAPAARGTDGEDSRLPG